MDKSFNKFICTTRVSKSSVSRKVRIDEFYSDRSRVLYSSSFRRLQQKAQVFSLEPNASVRTRLTHSLEVSDIGRTLANSIAYQLRQKSYYLMVMSRLLYQLLKTHVFFMILAILHLVTLVKRLLRIGQKDLLQAILKRIKSHSIRLSLTD